ncbi:2087_t:CDS:1, partial [Ambispora gerdemannii]
INTAIQNNIKRFGNQHSLMLSNILEKSPNKIIIDKVITSNGLSDHPKIIKDTIRQHFTNWTRKHITSSWPDSQWQAEYTPLSQVPNDAFASVSNLITMKEFTDMILNTNAYKAP